MSPNGKLLRSPRRNNLGRYRGYSGQASALGLSFYAAFDAVDGARSAASKCPRVAASKQTTLRGAVHG